MGSVGRGKILICSLALWNWYDILPLSHIIERKWETWLIGLIVFVLEETKSRQITSLLL